MFDQVVHPIIQVTQETEAGELQVRDLPGL